MANITACKVVYKRTVQPAPYESKAAEIELSCVIDPDDGVDFDETVDNLFEHAKDSVHAALGLRKAPR